MQLNISTLDLAIIVVYLLAIVGLGCYVGIRRRSSKGSGRDYFLAGGTLTWPLIGLALFSTNISTVHLVALAEEGYRNGLVYGNTEWMAGFVLVILALFFAPFYVRSRVATLPDFLEKRYSRACRDWLALMSIVSAIFIHIGFSLYAGAVVLRGMFGIDIMVSICVIAVLTGLYTTIGGLMAVVVTETIQTIVLLIGATLLTLIALHQVGGWSGLTETVDPIKFSMLRPHGDPSGMPWYAAILGYPVIGIWYWCTDQTIVQRVLGAKDENHARVGPIFAGFIKILPVFILILPGLICLALIKQGKLPDELENSADTYAFMIRHLLPTGLRGIMAAALLAALMSTVSGALNSVATLFSYDLFKRVKPQTSDHEMVIIGRIATFVAMLAAILWSPMVGRFETVFQGFAALICYIAPPIFAVFVLGVFWKTASSRGAIVTLIAGSAIGLTVFFLDFFKDRTGWNMNFWMAGFYLGMICIAIHVLVSLVTREPLTEDKARLVWAHPFDALKSPGWPGIGNYKLLAAVLLCVMITLYILFA